MVSYNQFDTKWCPIGASHLESLKQEYSSLESIIMRRKQNEYDH
ncbi:MAG: hypothetical protein K0S39_5613 [Paenibacillus sp.]|jgi:hypothetical protein|nr:hypothetical protein [Paenibacillus sp.]